MGDQLDELVFADAILQGATRVTTVIRLRSRLDRLGRSQMSPKSTVSGSSANLGAKAPIIFSATDGWLVIISFPFFLCRMHHHLRRISRKTPLLQSRWLLWLAVKAPASSDMKASLA